MKYGGFYDLNETDSDKIKLMRDSEGMLALLKADDSMAPLKHVMHLMKEEIRNGPAGYVYKAGLPIMREVNLAIQRLKDSGVIHQVKSFLRGLRFCMPAVAVVALFVDVNNLMIIQYSYWFFFVFCCCFCCFCFFS